MKIAIFHNYMDNIGGAEIVGLTMAMELGADLYSTNIDRKKIAKLGFSHVNVLYFLANDLHLFAVIPCCLFVPHVNY